MTLVSKYGIALPCYCAISVTICYCVNVLLSMVYYPVNTVNTVLILLILCTVLLMLLYGIVLTCLYVASSTICYSVTLL